MLCATDVVVVCAVCYRCDGSVVLLLAYRVLNYYSTDSTWRVPLKCWRVPTVRVVERCVCIVCTIVLVLPCGCDVHMDAVLNIVNVLSLLRWVCACVKPDTGHRC